MTPFLWWYVFNISLCAGDSGGERFTLPPSPPPEFPTKDRPDREPRRRPLSTF